MKTVKMIANGLGEREFSPEHAFALLRHQVADHTAEKSCWSIVSPEWEFTGGKLMLKKIDNESQPDTGVGDGPKKRKRDSAGDNPQP
jgi:hypothetical protein